MKFGHRHSWARWSSVELKEREETFIGMLMTTKRPVFFCYQYRECKDCGIVDARSTQLVPVKVPEVMQEAFAK